MRYLLTLMVVGFMGPTAHALKDYRDLPACGSAKVLSGDTCSNVKVELNFDGCAMKSEPKPAQRIVCVGNTIKARFQNETYRYEAQFEKKADDWGGAKWTSLGAVSQWEKKKVAAVHHEAEERDPASMKPAADAAAKVINLPPTEAPKAVSAAAPAAPAAPVSPWKFGAFADLRYTNYSSTLGGDASGYAQAQSGWGLEDGALYASYEKDRFSAIADIAFRRQKNWDFDPNGQGQSYSNLPNIVFGDDRSQLYFRYKLTDSLIVDFGQFDTIFGVELNDSKDRIFGKTGIVYDAMIPVTHTGTMVEYSFSGFSAKVFGANSSGRGSRGYVPATRDEQVEVGAAVGYSNDIIHGQIGYLARPIQAAGTTDMKSHGLFDATLGAVLGRFAIDLEWALLNDPSKNTLNASIPNDTETPGTGYLALVSYKITDALLIGARVEHLDNDPGSLKWLTANSYGASVHYRVVENLEARLDYVAYTFDSTDAATGNWNESRFAAGGLIAF